MSCTAGCIPLTSKTRKRCRLQICSCLSNYLRGCCYRRNHLHNHSLRFFSKCQVYSPPAFSSSVLFANVILNRTGKTSPGTYLNTTFVVSPPWSTILPFSLLLLPPLPAPPMARRVASATTGKLSFARATAMLAFWRWAILRRASLAKAAPAVMFIAAPRKMWSRYDLNDSWGDLRN